MTEIIIRGYHLDGYQHVNNARYLEFLEEARWASMSDELDFLAEHKLAFIVANININFRSPALLGQHIYIETIISKIGNKSGLVTQTIRCKKTKKTIADADVTFVIFDTKTNKVLPIIDELLNKLLKCKEKLENDY